MVKRGRTPNLTAHQESGVYFPITENRTTFNNSLKGKRPKLPGVRRADVAIIRRYQPYHYRKRGVSLHILWVLDDLSRNDKHRSIQPVLGTPEIARFQITQATDCVVTRVQRRALRKSLKVGSELGRFYVRKTGPNPSLQVQGEVPVAPAINDRIQVDKWLLLTMQIIFTLLAQCAEPPASVDEMVGSLGLILPKPT